MQRGIYELVAVDKIKIVQSFSKGMEFVLDIKNLYLDTSKEGQHFVMVSTDEVCKILSHECDMKKKISILKYYVALISSFDWSTNMKVPLNQTGGKDERRKQNDDDERGRKKSIEEDP